MKGQGKLVSSDDHRTVPTLMIRRVPSNFSFQYINIVKILITSSHWWKKGLQSRFIKLISPDCSNMDKQSGTLVPVAYEPGPTGLHVARGMCCGWRTFGPGS
jgi:hypothetical protein